MSIPRRILYLPIELAERELDSKIYLGIHAAKHGYSTVLGQHGLLLQNLHKLVPGVLLLKGMNKIDLSALATAQENGFIVAALEEESLGVASMHELVAGISNEFLSKVDLICAQGNNHLRALKQKNSNIGTKTTLCGNPRIDLLRPQFRERFSVDVDAIKSEFGDYILINTNFGWVNSVWGPPKAVYKLNLNTGYIDLQNHGHATRVRSRVESETKDLSSYRGLVKFLAHNFPRKKLIIRPHPSELTDTWEEYCRKMSNVKIICEGSANKWAMGADLVIHRSCTTGLESFLLDRPTVSFCPDDSVVFDECFVNQVTVVAKRFDEVRMMVADPETARGTRERNKKDTANQLRDHLTNAEGETSVQNILNSIEIHFGGRLSPENPRSDPRLRGFVGKIQRDEKHVRRMSKTIREMTNNVSQISRCIDDDTKVKVIEIGDNLFQIN